MNLEAFYKGNAEQIENVKQVISERFLDKDGKPIEWEIKCLFRIEEEEIMKTCVIHSDVPRRGLDIDNRLFTSKLIANSVVYPDLNNAQLQDTYGVMSADQLVRAMLTSMEYAKVLLVIRSFGLKKRVDVTNEEELEESNSLE